MKLYRFSPILTTELLYKAIKHIHIQSHILCMNSFGKYLPNSGNMGVFCHYDKEFDYLKQIQATLCKPSDNPNQKYFELLSPILVSENENIPETTYTHLYIRRSDPYRHHVGDIDFYVEIEKYTKLKVEMVNGKVVKDARIFDRTDLDMIELYNPDIDVLAYVSTNQMTQNVRIKQSEVTKL
ncbi:hypothetical protein KBD45_00990 [Candidatus Dojkabacteria bacterium]|nr:hypothetical protein [Candidatus Dojkabacteria bacterium]